MKLSELFTIRLGYTPSKQSLSNKDGVLYKGIDCRHIREGDTDYINLYVLDVANKLAICSNKVACRGDIILTSKGADIRVVIVGDDFDGKLCMFGGLMLLTPKEGVNSLYIKLFLESPEGYAALRAINRCVRNPKDNYFSIEDISNLEVAYPFTAVGREQLDKNILELEFINKLYQEKVSTILTLFKGKDI